MSHDHYFSWDIDLAMTLVGDYNVWIVVLSYLIASIAGFCSLSIINFIKINNTNSLQLKLFGSIVLGLGVWSMHFTGMLAFTLPLAVFYSLKTTLLSIIPAIIASFIVLHNLSKTSISKVNILWTSLILAIGIATMHFVGMSAMSMQADMIHDPILYTISIISSWVLAILTLAIQTNHISTFKHNNHYKIILSALFFGFSVASMHYLAMAATYFIPDSSIVASGIDDRMMTFGVIIIVVILMALFTLMLFYKSKINKLIELASSHQKRIAETIDHMQDGFVLSDEFGDILLVNQRFNDIFTDKDIQFDLSTTNRNIDEMYKKIMDRFFKFSTEEERNSALEKINGKDSSNNFKIQSENNKWWVLRKNITSTNALIQTWTDITDQVNQEDELLEAKKMASLSGLVTGIAHELNTPLGVGITAISSIKEIVENTQELVNTNKIKKYQLVNALDTIAQFEDLAMNNFKRVVNLIQQFRYISVEQEIEDPRRFTFSNMMMDILPTWEKTAKKANITIEAMLPTQKTPLFSYEKALSQVINSLIKNSLEHAFIDIEGNKITISATFIEDRLIIKYSDNGRGIDKNIINNIFDPFITTNRSQGGIGLGLHIAYNLVNQKLKGKIKLDQRQEGQHTIFIINIPIKINQTATP